MTYYVKMAAYQKLSRIGTLRGLAYTDGKGRPHRLYSEHWSTVTDHARVRIAHPHSVRKWILKPAPTPSTGYGANDRELRQWGVAVEFGDLCEWYAEAYHITVGKRVVGGIREAEFTT